MTTIRGSECPCRERTSKVLSGSSPLLESNYDKTPVNPPAVELFVTKYIEKDLQKIFRTFLEARAPSSDGLCKKPLKARLPNVYCGKSHIEYYNFCQQCEDHFATTRTKGLNYILFVSSFLRDCINFY